MPETNASKRFTMGTSTQYSLMLKLTTIILTLLFNPHLDHKYIVAAQDFEITPLWDVHDINSSLSCHLHNSTGIGGQIVHTFAGDAYEFCNLQVSTSTDSFFVLDVPPHNDSNPVFLFFERKGNLDICPGKYVVVENHPDPCHTVLLESTFQMNLLGSASISFQEGALLGSGLTCPESTGDNQLIDIVKQNPRCDKVKGYNDMISCVAGLDGDVDGSCRMEFPNSCNACLKNSEVIFECLGHDSQKVLLVYPIIIQLDLSRNGIVHIGEYAFRKLPNLEVLNLGGNLLGEMQSDVFCDLDWLSELDLSDNLLKSIDIDLFGNLPELSVLFLQRNQLITLQLGLFSKTMKLTQLELDENELKDLPPGIFNNLTHLNRLRLVSNQLESLDASLFQGMHELTYLSLSRNVLTSLPVPGLFRGLHNVTLLSLSRNRLRLLSGRLFHNMTSLEELYLYANMLTNLPSGLFSGLNNLIELYLHENQLVEVPGTLFQDLGMLTYLWLSSNNLTTLPSNLFNNVGNLERLYLNNNQLVIITEDLFHNLTKLILLSLSGNCLATLPAEGFRSLEELQIFYLHENKLALIENGTFRNLIQLTTLNLYENNLSIIPADLFHSLGNLKILSLSQNKLTVIDEGAFRNLTLLARLNLYENKLSIIPADLFNSLGNLEILSLSQNKLTVIDEGAFRNLTQLARLNLYENNLSMIPADLFNSLGNLEILSLSQNKLTVIEDGAFRSLIQLKLLFLYENNLTSLPADLFHTLGNLLILYAQDNMIMSLSNNTFHGLANLEQLFLYNNPIQALDSRQFQGLYKLTYLNMENTSVGNLPIGLFDDIVNIQKMLFENCQIKEVDINLFPNLTRLYSLDLPRNNLTTVSSGTFSDTWSMETLFLAHNQIYQIDSDVFQPMPKLRVLALQNNRLLELSSETFQGLVSLEGLGLNDNPGIKLGPGIFKDITNIQSIFLSENRLAHLPSDFFNNTIHVEFLDLSMNQLQQIPTISYLRELVYFNLRDNPLLMVTQDTFSSLPNNTELFVSQQEICECFSPSHVICSAADDRSPYLTCDRLLADRTLVVMMWVIGLNALGGNIFVLAWRQKTTQKNKVQAMLLSSLAMSDLLMGVYMVIVASADVYFGEDFPLYSETWRSGATCRISGTLSIFSSEASVFFVTLISVDRFVSVRFPYANRRLNRHLAQIIVTITWIVSFILGIVPSILAGRNFKFYDNSHVCIGLPLALTELFVTNETEIEMSRDGYAYTIDVFNTTSKGMVPGMYFSTVIFLGLNLLCYITIFICYAEIVRTVYKSSKRAGLNKEMKEQLRMTAKVAAIVITDFACWFPIILLGILVQARVLTLPPSVFAWSVTFVLPINSAINPYLYTIAAIISSRRKGNEISVIRTGTVVQDRGSMSQTQVTHMNPASTSSQPINGEHALPNVPTNNNESNV